MTWPFEASKNTAVFTQLKILRKERPILAVWHNADDGAWQFLDASDIPDSKDMAVVSLEEMTKLEPAVLELADLPEGWVAFRRDAGAPWVRRRES